MKTLNKQGVLIAYNTDKNFFEVQKIDDAENFAHEMELANVKQLASDDEAKKIAIKHGIKFLDAENPYKIDRFYSNNGSVITIQFDKYGTKDRNLGELFDWLGEECQIVQANELYQYACLDDSGNIFELTNSDEMKLARDGQVELTYTGETINDYKDSHRDFYKWFFNLK